jgi:hypothetical protein
MPIPGGDGTIVRFGVTELWSILLTLRNFALASAVVAWRNSCGYLTLAQLEVADATLLFRRPVRIRIHACPFGSAHESVGGTLH